MKAASAWILVLVLSTATLGQAAGANVAYVRTQRVLEQAPQARAASERLQQEFAPRESAIATAQRNLKALQEKRERDGAVMADAERTRLEREIVAQQRELKRSQAEYTEDLALRRRDEFARFQREAADTIAVIAREGGFDLVIEAGVVYASDTIDITDKVVARLREQYSKQSSKAKP